MKFALDAGHGGTDPGAVGPSGLQEAPTCLLICNQLADILQGFNHQTILTRTKEVYVSLGTRCTIANDWGADYFVSIHCNSNGPTAVGIETLYKTDAGCPG